MSDMSSTEQDFPRRPVTLSVQQSATENGRSHISVLEGALLMPDHQNHLQQYGSEQAFLQRHSFQPYPSVQQTDGGTAYDKPRVVRKRRRVPVVCAVCRQRKLKCDRKTPCAACVAHDTVSMCTYSAKPWASSGSEDRGGNVTVSLSSRLQVENDDATHSTGIAKVVDPKSRELATLARNRPVRISQAELNATPEYIELKARMERVEGALLKLTDPGIFVAENTGLGDKGGRENGKMTSFGVPVTTTRESGLTMSVSASAMDMRILQPEISIKKNRLTYFGPLSGVAAIREDEFIKKCLDQVDRAKKILARKACESRNGTSTENITVPEKGHTSHDTSAPRKVFYIPPELKDWVETIFDVNASPIDLFPRLEHRPICEFLIDQYLQKINVVFPIVNPAVFRSDMKKFWQAKELMVQRRNSGFNDSEESAKPFWMSTRKNDMRGAALFAVLLRLGRLSLKPEWKPSDENFDDSLIALFGPRLQAFTWSCLRETNYMGKPNLVVIQVLLGIRIHQMIAPEDGDGSDGSDAAGFIGMMCQVAMSMGLHRDPSLLPRMPPILADTWRLLWSQLVLLDTYRSHDLGLPFAIPLEMCDTALDKICDFGENVSQQEQFSLSFQKTHIEWALLSRNIISRILRPDYVLSLQEFRSLTGELNRFEESHLSSFQSLISVIQAGAAVSGPQDSYNLIQKFLIQLLFLRLQLSLLRSYAPPNLETAEVFRRERLRCALKMLDTLATCMYHRQLFNGYEWLLVPFSLRNFFYPVALVMNGLLKAYYSNPDVTLPPIPQGWEDRGEEAEDERWLSPDVAFRYDDASVCDLYRLYQAFVKTHMWIKLFCSTYYGAYKPNCVVRVLSEFVRHEVVGGSEHSQRQTDEEERDHYSYTADTERSTHVPTDISDSVSPSDNFGIFGSEEWASSLAMFGSNDYTGSWQDWHAQMGGEEPTEGLKFSFDGFGSAQAYS